MHNLEYRRHIHSINRIIHGRCHSNVTLLFAFLAPTANLIASSFIKIARIPRRTLSKTHSCKLCCARSDTPQ